MTGFSVFLTCILSVVTAETLPLKLTLQVETSERGAEKGSDPLEANAGEGQTPFRIPSEKSGRFHRVEKKVDWVPSQTALILCDVWDSHTSQRAVQRVEELLPRLEETKNKLRSLGVTVIHAPSGCMATYASHPARLRAQNVPASTNYPSQIESWCYQIPAEEAGKYPLDQSNGGADDKPDAKEAWGQELVRQGRNPKSPWRAQHEKVSIDGEKDFISDSGKEIWNILESKGIENVVLAGVHTNMCVLGRPFGLRRMVLAGKNAALLSDLTDTMYDPGSFPYVSHFTGTDLIIDHIERHVCPTFTSDQIVGGSPFRFAEDKRPTVAFIMAEDEYSTETTLPPWSISQLGKEYRLRWIFGSEESKIDIPGLDAIAEADLLVISARRRPLRPEQMQMIRAFEKTGKPMLGIRTASHAFSLRKPSDEGPDTESWPEIDREAWGGSYTNHYPNDKHPAIGVVPGNEQHAIVKNWGKEPYVSGGSLYRVSPIASEGTPLLAGRLEGFPEEPVAWTFRRANGGVSFYTSLGHRTDFEQPRFQVMLKDAVDWLILNRGE